MPGALVSNVVLFGRVLRAAGLEVHPGRMPDAIAALDCVGVRSRADVRATLRTLLVHRREDLPLFDAAFDQFWRSHDVAEGLPLFSLGERPRVVARRVTGSDLGLEIDAVSAATDAAARVVVGAYSRAEVSRTKDFGSFSEEEVRRAEAVVANLGERLGTRRTRRWRTAPHGAIDLRRVARRSLRYGGELVDLPRRARVEKPRPIVVLCDVSGSMERYSRMLLQFVFAIGSRTARSESFVFATRLTRVTREVAAGAGGRTRLAAVARAVQDWGGGTRIGDSLRAFNVHWARRVMRHGPVVLIVSDGWDRGDPALVGCELARLHRRCSRLIWLNPLLGSASYEPLTRGMQAALDYVDDFMPAHNLASLEQLARFLVDLDSRRRSPTHAWTSTASTSSTLR